MSFRSRFETLAQLMARYYNTTKLAARKRLVELGYHEAKGIGNYADGKAIPAFSCAKGVLGRNQTFLIGLNPQDDKNNPIPGIKCCPTQNSPNEKHEHMGKAAKLSVDFVYIFCIVGQVTMFCQQLRQSPAKHSCVDTILVGQIGREKEP